MEIEFSQFQSTEFQFFVLISVMQLLLDLCVSGFLYTLLAMHGDVITIKLITKHMQNAHTIYLL